MANTIRQRKIEAIIERVLKTAFAGQMPDRALGAIVVEQIPDCAVGELYAALDAIAARAAAKAKVAATLQRIGKKFKAKRHETVNEVVARAVAGGDPEALFLMSSGALDVIV
jgi:hypothetical protein